LGESAQPGGRMPASELRTRPLRARPLAIAWRWAAFLAVWTVLGGNQPATFLAGIAASGLATRLSFQLLPRAGLPFRPVALARFLARFAVQTVQGGVDVARRAFDPALPVQPGFILHPTHLGPGIALDSFRALSSLQPGTVPVGLTADGAMAVHCLDTEAPVAAQMAQDEARFRAAFDAGTRHA